MTWPTPLYSRTAVDRAGADLVSLAVNDERFSQSLAIVSNWRSSHGYPINTFQATLRKRTWRIDPNALIAQRLKRLPSIVGKLDRFPQMQLSRMQDIGGLRAVVSTVAQVRQLESIYSDGSLTHSLYGTRDYIGSPKASGYRSLHFVYKYKNPTKPEYDGLLLELQLRTRLQHAWATAVETLGAILNSALKSSEGPDEWLDFFALASGGIALLEDCPPIPACANWSRDQTFAEIANAANRLNVRNRLAGFSIALKDLIYQPLRTAYFYHLILLDLDKKVVNVQSFARDDLAAANEAYTTSEKASAGANVQVVLVSAGPLDALKKAYPNYFGDTQEFIRALDLMR